MLTSISICRHCRDLDVPSALDSRKLDKNPVEQHSCGLHCLSRRHQKSHCSKERILSWAKFTSEPYPPFISLEWKTVRQTFSVISVWSEGSRLSIQRYFKPFGKGGEQQMRIFWHSDSTTNWIGVWPSPWNPRAFAVNALCSGGTVGSVQSDL